MDLKSQRRSENIRDLGENPRNPVMDFLAEMGYYRQPRIPLEPRKNVGLAPPVPGPIERNVYNEANIPRPNPYDTMGQQSDNQFMEQFRGGMEKANLSGAKQNFIPNQRPDNFLEQPQQSSPFAPQSSAPQMGHSFNPVTGQFERTQELPIIPPEQRSLEEFIQVPQLRRGGWSLNPGDPEAMLQYRRTW